MSDFEMPYFIDGGGNKGYFKDTTARDQISGKQDVILRAYSGSGLGVNDTYQISTDMLNRDMIAICINRFAWAGGVVLTTTQIKSGDCGAGVKIVTGAESNPTQDMYAILTISNTGLITVKYLNNYAPYIFLQLIAI
jgi:hypothetical protein